MPTNNPEKPWIQGTEMAAPDDSFYVNDYPYVRPRQVDHVCLVTVLALVAAYLIIRKAAPRRVLERLPAMVRLLSTPLLVLLFFAVLEGVLWFTVQRQPGVEFHPDPVSIWRVRAPVIGEEARTNSLGLIGPEVAVEKAPGTLRILSLGDSRTMGGAGADPSLAYPMVLQEQLNRLRPSQKVEVIQGAVSGFSSYQGLLLHRNLGLRLRPDVVTVAFGYQDGMRDWTPDKHHISDNYALTLARGLLYKSNLFLVLRKNVLDLKRYRLNRERDTVPSFPRVSVSDFEQNMIEMIRLAREGGARVLFIEMPQNPLFEVDHKGQDPAYARALQRLLKLYIGAADVFYVDLRKFFQAPMRAANGGRAHTRYFVDDCHLTAHGHRLVAVHLASFLEKAGLLTDAR